MSVTIIHCKMQQMKLELQKATAPRLVSIKHHTKINFNLYCQGDYQEHRDLSIAISVLARI